MNELPRRDDVVAAWLRRSRETWPARSAQWYALDEILDEYRLHADTGTPLDEHACDGPNCCAGYVNMDRLDPSPDANVQLRAASALAEHYPVRLVVE